MTNAKIFTSFAFALLVFALVSGAASAATLGEWALTSDGSVTNSHSDVNAGSFIGGSGISAITYGANGGYAGQWSMSSLEADDYFQVSISPDTGYDLTVTDVNFDIRRSGTGPTDYDVKWSKSSSFSSSTTIASGVDLADDLSHDGSISSLNVDVQDGETLYVRWYGYNAGATTGTLRIDADSLSLEGTVSAAATNPSLKIRVVSALDQSGSGTIKVENDGDTSLTGIDLSSSGDFTLSFSSDNFNLAAGASKTVTVSSTDIGEVDFGGKSVGITAVANDGTSDTLNLTVQGSFCELGEVGGDLKIKSVEIDNNGEGEDDEWMLLDEIEIEVEVENTGDDDIDDVVVEIGLYDQDGDNQISDFEFDNEDEEEIELGDLDDDDEETVTFKFKVPADFEDGDYKLVVKAYSDDLGEDVECVETSKDLDEDDRYMNIDVQREDDEGKFIAFDDIEFTPAEATCGETVTMTMDVYNIGDEDQEQVRIELKNTKLGISEVVEIRSDLDQGDSESISFTFVVPQNAEDDFYTLELSSEYDYKRGTYRESSDDEEKVPFRVLGCSPSSGGSGGDIALISASMDSSDAVAGSTVVVRASVTNLKSERAGLIVDATGYQSWATLNDVSPRVVDLQPGASADVLLTFTIDEDADGQESFDIQVQDGSGSVAMREVALNVEGEGSSSGISFSGLGGSPFIWVIGAINLILIILIIIVAVRVARR